MRRSLMVIAAMVVAGSALPVAGQVVVNDVNLSMTYASNGVSSGVLGYTVWQDAAKTDWTFGEFDYNASTAAYKNTALDEGSDWFLVQPGDVFSAARIAAGQFPPIVTFGPQSYPPVSVGAGDFYLGVRTGQGATRDCFGWVQLRQISGIGTTVVMIDNVMSYDSRGIIVGTTTVVPEPAASGLGLVGLGAVIRMGRGRSRVASVLV
jgi:hypothetical protein